MDLEKRLQYLEEEAQANLVLHESGEDEYALTRYKSIMESVVQLRNLINDKRQYSNRSN
jgi:hypothetical protein